MQRRDNDISSAYYNSVERQGYTDTIRIGNTGPRGRATVVKTTIFELWYDQIDHINRDPYVHPDVTSDPVTDPEPVTITYPVYPNGVYVDGLSQKEKDKLLVEIISFVEQDPTMISYNKFKRTFSNGLSILKNRNNGRVNVRDLISLMKRINKDQENPFVNCDLEDNQIMHLNALPQSVKTSAMAFIAWKCGVLKSNPSVFMSFNRCNEDKRFDKTFRKFNKMVEYFAEAIGINKNSTPVLKTHLGDITKVGNDYGKSVEKMRKYFYNPDEPRNGDYFIPVVVVMPNESKMNKIGDFLDRISYSTGLDSSNKSMNAILISDEAELHIKSRDKSSVLEKLMHNKVFRLRERIYNPDPAVVAYRHCLLYTSPSPRDS